MNNLVSVEEFEVNKAKYVCVDCLLPVTVSFCLGNERSIIKNAQVSIKIVKNRYKFPLEVVFTLRSSKANKIIKETRNSSSWNTLEAYLDLTSAKALFSNILNLIKEEEKKVIPYEVQKSRT